MERLCDAAATLLRARDRRSSYFCRLRTSDNARRGLDEVRVASHDESRASGGACVGVTTPTATPTAPRAAGRGHLYL